jgi:hypothetical protein
MLDFVDEPLDQIAILVDVLVIRNGLRSGAGRRDHGLPTAFRDMGAKTIGVKTHISEQVLERETADQIFGLEDVMRLAWGEDEADGIAEGIHANVDLRAQTAARTPDRLIFAPPFWAPAAC